MVSFSAVDATSGVSYYEIKMDQAEFKKVSSPYLPSIITSGDHTFTVRAFDKAGNVAEGIVKIKIRDIPVPTITKPKKNETFKLAQHLNIQGRADKNTVVDLYLDGVNIARAIKVGENGKWSFSYNSFIMPGKHQIFAIAIKDGIESKTSDKINIRIDPSAISIFGVIVPSWVVFALLIVIITILFFMVLWLFIFGKRKYDNIRKKIRERNDETQKSVEKEFFNMEKKLRGDVQTVIDKESSGEKAHRIEQEIEGRVEKDVEKTEKVIEEDIKKEIKDL